MQKMCPVQCVKNALRIKESQVPSKTKRQSKFMQGCAHNPEKMQGKCPPVEVAKEFAAADQRKNARRRGKNQRGK